MHMHTVKVAILERPGGFDFDAFVEEVRGPARQAAAVPQADPASTPLRLNHPVWIADRELDPAGTSSGSRSRRRAGMQRARGAGRPDHQRAAGPLDPAVGAARLRGARGRPGRRRAPSCTTRWPTATPPTTCSPTSPARSRLVRVAARPRAHPVARPAGRRRRCVDAIKQVFSLPGAARADDGRRWPRWSRSAGAPRSRRRGRSSTCRAPRSTAPLGSRRNFATCTLSARRDQGGRRHAHGVTLNDVVLGRRRRRAAALDGRRAASARTASLTAGVPVGTDPPGAAPRLQGNRVSNLFTTLATDVDDPHERLADDLAGSPTRPSSCSGPSAPTCSSTGCSSPRRRRSRR